jgi:hypothetical protein
LAIVGVDDAEDPPALIGELLDPLAAAGVRLVIAFSRPWSAAWELAQAHWPDHDLDEDDPAVVAERITALTDRVADVAACEDALLRRRTSIGLRIAAVPDVPTRAMALRLRLSTLRKSVGEGNWTWLVAQLDACEAAAERIAVRVADLDAALTALLDRRGELLGRLDAAHDRAVASGVAGDPVLDRLYRQARDELTRAPCDLTAAATLVARYSQAVRGRERQPG